MPSRSSPSSLPALARAWAGLACGLGALGAAAQPAAAPAAEPSIDLGAGLVQILSSLGVVIALLLASLWAIRRLSAPRGAGAAIRVRGAAAVGPRERVVLVELGDKVLVLGVAPGRVNTLHVMDRDELPLPAETGMQAPKDFYSRLRQAVERRDGR